MTSRGLGCWPRTPPEARALRNDRTEHYIAMIDNEPIGWIQCWDTTDEPDEVAPWHQLGLGESAAGIDYLVGDPGQRGQGVGAAMIAAFVRDVVVRDARLATSGGLTLRRQHRLVEGAGEGRLPFVRHLRRPRRTMPVDGDRSTRRAERRQRPPLASQHDPRRGGVHHRRTRRRARRSAHPARRHPLARRRNGRRLVARRAAGLAARSVRVLAAPLRLARARGGAQPSRPVHRPDRRDRPALRASAFPARGRHPTPAQPRLAWLVRRVPSRDRATDQPDGARWERPTMRST